MRRFLKKMSQILLPSDMDLPYDKDFYKEYGIFIKPISYPMSSRKIEFKQKFKFIKYNLYIQIISI